MATIELDPLRTFATVCNAGSFAAAAERMAVPRSTVSRVVAKLEHQLDARLFQRTTRRMAVTEEGRVLYERVVPALENLESALKDVANRHEEPTGTVRVTATADIGAAVIAEAATRYALRYPRSRVDAVLTPRVVDLIRDGYDLAVRLSPGRLSDSALHARKVGTVSFGIYAAPSYLARHGIPRTADALRSHAWIGFRGALPGRLGAWLRTHGLTSDASRVVSDDIFFLRETLRRGAGLAAIPTFVVSDDVHAGVLVRVLPTFELPLFNVYVVQAAPRHAARRVTAFREVLLEVLRQSPLTTPPPR